MRTRTTRGHDVTLLEAGRAPRQALARFEVETRGPSLTDVTAAVAAAVERSGIAHGLATVFCRHTSASLTIQENASPEVLDDLVDALDRLAPRTAPWRHDLEGPDDMPAHVKTVLTGASVAVPVIEGRLALGTWQAVYLFEHRDRPHRRDLVVHVIGTETE